MIIATELAMTIRGSLRYFLEMGLQIVDGFGQRIDLAVTENGPGKQISQDIKQIGFFVLHATPEEYGSA